jgi:hypothetical protein
MTLAPFIRILRYSNIASVRQIDIENLKTLKVIVVELPLETQRNNEAEARDYMNMTRWEFNNA